MRGRKSLFRKLFLPLFLSVILIFTSSAIIVSAGNTGSDIISETMTSGTEFKLANWRIADETGLSLDNGTVHFDKKYKHNKPITSRNQVFTSEEIDNALVVSFSARLNAIVGGKTFGFIYGLEMYDRDVGEKDSTYVYFAALNEGFGVGVKNYKDGIENELKALTAIESPASVQLTVKSDGKLILYVNNQNIYMSANEGETKADGYIGFTSTSTQKYHNETSNYIDVEVSNLIARNEYYDKPETPKVSIANFDTNEYNTEEWYIRSTKVDKGEGVIVKDKVLRFEGAGQNSCIISKHQYSNFEFQFDVFDAKNEATDHGDGRVNTASAWISFSWGTSGEDSEFVAQGGYQASKYTLYFGESMDNDMESETFGDRTYTGVRLAAAGINLPRAISGPDAPEALREGYDFLSKGYTGKNVRIRVRMIDGYLTVGVKHVDEVEFHEVLSYRFKDGTTTGYVAIRCEGNNNASTRNDYVRGSYYSVDNILLLNYDKNATITKNITFTGNVKNVQDYDYRDPYTDDYLITNTGGKPTGAK